MTPEGGTLQDYAFREAPYVFTVTDFIILCGR